ncbi:MAG: T9SS type B sorting domain-containing protein [Bacteroidetes bacterium]|nr:MAG: T9SS type B sorting domain-containing protein [Bacteroidota bacterium]
MKQLFLFLVGWWLAIPLWAQAPSNDDCGNPIDLGIAPNCTTIEYTNVDATVSNIGSNNAPSCFTNATPGNDVWFTFTCPSSPLDFRVELTGVGSDPLTHPQLAVYRGVCINEGLAELDCVNGGPGSTELFLDLEALTPGAIYFIRVSDYSATGNANAGTFNLCVNEPPPIVTIDQGNSTLCQGTLYDSGGPDNDYGSNENHIFTICPSSPAACINFTLEYFNLDAGDAFTPGFDLLSFYDGPNVNAPLLAQLNSFSTPTGTDGGGGVCFQVQATSGCLTIQFQSDATVQFEGFKGSWICSPIPCEPKSSVEVETAVTNTDIVNAVTAPGTTVTITDINCQYGAYGTFNFPTDNNDLGLSKGLVLTSGSVDLVPGPNDDDAATSDNFEPGDPDLDYLSILQGANIQSQDACVIEMDVFVASDELAFEYVFGSEEYPEYANSQYNDIFAFLASGPGIAGDPNLNNAQNIAILPGTSTPVEINSVNNIVNWEHYRNNGVWKGSTLQYDGLTSDFLGVKKSLTARVNVIPCNTYHLKLAVADRFDGVYDSGVFISEVRGGAPGMSVEFASGLDYFIEDCTGTQDQLIIRLSQPKTTAASYTVTIGGSATQGMDYLLNIPSVITFPPGDSVLTFPIIPLTDTLLEGTETITISLSNDFGCGTVVFQTLTLELKDNAEVLINAGADTLFVCSGGTAQLEATGALSYFWEPPLLVSDPNVPNPTITPTQDMLLQVTGSIANCVDTDSVYVKIINAPTLDVELIGAAGICLGDTVQLLATTNTDGLGLSWSPKTRLSDPSSMMPLAYPLEPTTYTATVQIPGCPPVSETITVGVDTLFMPGIPFADTTICQNFSIQIGETLLSSTQYAWTPTEGLDDPTLAGPLATPDQSTVYTLTATSANGYCSQTATVNVNIIPADVEIQGPDYIEICLGDTLTLDAQSAPAGAEVKWQPGFYVTPSTGSSVKTAPDESVTILATYNINGCLVYDSIRIRVDSLPDLALTREPDKEVYCPGDTIYLISRTYEPASFPDMTHLWLPFGGELTPDSNWNMVILATSTHTFQRISSNNACVDTAEVEIPVGIPPDLVVTADPQEICPGESSQLLVTVDPDQSVEWEDPTGSLSCTDCKNPTASPGQTTSYSVSVPEADCPAGASITVTVLSPPPLDLTDKTICLGGSVVLNNIPANPQDTYTWTVAPPGNPASLSSLSAPNPTANPTVTTSYNVVAQGPKCTSSGEITVTVNNATIDAGTDQTACFGDPVTLTASVTGTPGTITWLPGPGTGNSVSVTPSVSTTYTAVLTFQPNCTVLDSVQVTVIPGISLSDITADPSQDTICEGTLVTLKVTADPPDLEFTWLENNTPIPGAVLDSVMVSPPGDVNPVSVSYSVIATDAFGCTATSGPFEQLVIRCFVFPNAFTPDGDGNNDTFGGIQTFGGDLEIVEYRVFSRWGQKVFEATDNQKVWDGRVDGKEAPSDVYVYYITVRFANGDEKSFKGDVTLLR